MYSTKYLIEYRDINNSKTTIEIQQKDYEGEVIPLEKFGSDPLTVKWYGEGQGKYIPIKQSECKINLMSMVNFEWEEFADFQEREYLVRILKDGRIFWIGYLIADNYNEEWETPPYEVRISGIDYLTSLKDLDFTDSEGGIIYDSLDIISIMQLIFSKIGLELPILDGITINHQTTPSTTGALKNTKIDCRNFIKDIYTDKQTAFNCEDVLKEILTAFGATLKQNRGRWEIFNFDSENPEFYGWTNNGDSLGIITNSEVKYLDDNGLKIVSGSANLEIEGARRAISIIHDTSLRDSVIKGGNFFDDAWISNTEHKYLTSTEIPSREGNTLYFPIHYNNISYNDLDLMKSDAKLNYIELEVDFNRLPFVDSRSDNFLDFQLSCKVRPHFAHPAGRGTDPGFVESEYQDYLSNQIDDLFNGIEWGQYFRATYTGELGLTFYLLQRQIDAPTLRFGDLIWSPPPGGGMWLDLIRPMQSPGVLDRKTLVNELVDNPGSGDISNFRQEYDFRRRINLYRVDPGFIINSYYYKKSLSVYPTGKINFKISAPWFSGVQNHHQNIPVEYQVNFTGINTYIDKLDLINDAHTHIDEKVYTSQINSGAVRKMDTIQTKIGDSGPLNLGSLLDNSGNPTSLWYDENLIALPMLQHTADRIIKQYNSPSYTLRTTVLSSEIIDGNTLIINPLTDKIFRIQGLELNDKEALYTLELKEINKPLNLQYNENINLLLAGGIEGKIYDLSFALIACLGNREYQGISDEIITTLESAQGVDGSFQESILSGSGSGVKDFRTQGMALYALTYYMANRVHKEEFTARAKTMAIRLNTFLLDTYFKNPIGLGFDNNMISTIDNVIYWFGLRSIDRDKAGVIKSRITKHLITKGNIASGLSSSTNSRAKLYNDSLLLKSIAYLFTKDNSIIEGVTDYYSGTMFESLLLSICYYKSGNYSKWEAISSNSQTEPETISLLQNSIKVLASSKLKNNIF